MADDIRQNLQLGLNTMQRFVSGGAAEDDPEGKRVMHIVQGKFVNDDNSVYVANHIQTSKYTWKTFIPKNLLEQIIRPANMYYLVILALQSIPAVSTSSGVPLITIPLTSIFAVTAVKDLMEDKKRKREDEFENKRRVERLNEADPTFHELVLSEDIKVGDIVKVRDGNRFPADLLLINCRAGPSAPYCYVETSNIDGETNLKVKQIPNGLNTIVSFDPRDPEDAPFPGTIFGPMNEDDFKVTPLNQSDGYEEFCRRFEDTYLEVALPDDQLDTWNGRLVHVMVPDDEIGGRGVKYHGKDFMVGHDNLLLRGSELRNSDFIYGMVVYTGGETKIFMNNKSRSTAFVKRSSVEKRLNKMILIMAVGQVVLCLLCAIISYRSVKDHQANNGWYLPPFTDAQIGLVKFFTWFIIFAQFIPISLLVSMEMVKYIQAKFMQWDILMYRQLPSGDDVFCNVQNSTLNEDLGQVDFVFSDKTGTLTENSLDFRKCVMGGLSYGRGETEISRAAKLREMDKAASPEPGLNNPYSLDPAFMQERANDYPHVNFDEIGRVRTALRLSEMNQTDVQAQYVRRFITILALNNSCFPVIDQWGNRVLRSASPDDECLTYFAEFAGARIAEKQHPNVKLALSMGPSPGDVVEEIYETLAELEFTSKRKRMSVVFRNKQTGQIHFTMKGADSEMFRLIDDVRASPNYAISVSQMESFADEGLRTLVIGEAIHDADWWDDDWEEEFKKFAETTAVEGPLEKGHIKGSCSDECRKCKFYEEWEEEAKVELVGVTAIEDKLQSEVPQTIRALLDGGMKVWVLTGDKQRTAENIGLACNLLEPEMFHNGLLFRLLDPATLTEDIDLSLGKIKDTYEQKGTDFRAAIVVNSQAVAAIMSGVLDVDGDRDLVDSFLNLAELCRAVIGVRLQPNQKAQIVKLMKVETGATCLSVGDGANDEPMIREANIGVGINGVEGTAAVRASDYAIGQFRFLRRLLFVHGRLHYRRVSILICYIFYKNGLISMTQFWYGIVSMMAGQRIYLEWAYQLYNVAYTAFPILVFAVIDADYDDKELMENPGLYRLTQNGKLFNNRIFFAWIADSILESCVLAMFPFGAFSDITSADSSGQSFGMWSYGIAVYTAILFTSNLRLIMISRTYTNFTYLIFFLTFFSYFLSMLVFSLHTIWSIGGGDYYGMFPRLFLQNARFWLTVIVTTTFALLPAFAFTAGRELLVSKEANKDKEMLERTHMMLTKASTRSLTTGVSTRSLEPSSPGEKKPLIIVG